MRASTCSRASVRSGSRPRRRSATTATGSSRSRRCRSTSRSWPRPAAPSCCPRRPPTGCSSSTAASSASAAATRAAAREGEPLGNFEPGSDIVAKVTVLAEGTAGHLTGAALDHFGLNGPEPQIWELGVKEIWRVPRPLTKVIHTMGWPLRKRAKYREFGGSWLYPMGEDLISLGFVVGLDYRDVELSAHDLLQEFKTHRVHPQDARGRRARRLGREDDHERRLARDAEEPRRAGAAPHGRERRPRRPGAAEGRPLRDRVGPPRRRGRVPRPPARREPGRMGVFDAYDAEVRNGYLGKSLREVRNMRQAFEKGFFVGGGLASAMTVSKGHFPADRAPQRARRGGAAPAHRTARRATPRPTARSRSTSSRRSSPRATARATTSRTTSGSSATFRATWPRCGRGCARRRCTRSATRTATAPSR